MNVFVMVLKTWLDWLVQLGTWPLIGLIKIDDLTIKIISSTSKNQELDIFPIIWLVLFLNHGFLKNKRMCLPIILQECTNVKKINKWVFFFFVTGKFVIK